MKIFKDGCEIRLTYRDLYDAIHYWLHKVVFMSDGYGGWNKSSKGLVIKSLSLHPGNKYGAKITIGYPEDEEK